MDRDDSDPEDVKIWGYFCVYNYDLEGDVLKTASGGAHPGLFHIKDNKDGTAEVTAFDQTEDGAGYEPSAKKIFGDTAEEIEFTASRNWIRVEDEEKADAVREGFRRRLSADLARSGNAAFVNFTDDLGQRHFCCAAGCTSTDAQKTETKSGTLYLCGEHSQAAGE